MLKTPFIFCILFLLNSCASLPSNIDTPKTYALQDTENTKFGRNAQLVTQGKPLDSGFVLLPNGLDAYTARIAIIRHAERSIDAQYYMIHHDLVGSLFAEQLVGAAERGVRVRLLLDDIDLEGRDETFTTAASHPNISVRVFNPFSRSFRSRTSQFITGFDKVTRRMHNKSLTVDNQVAIVGGRNIGDEYFDADSTLAFSDLDLLATGPVVKEVSSSFDAYWNSDFAYPIELLRPDLSRGESYKEKIVELQQSLDSDDVLAYKKRLVDSALYKKIHSHTVLYQTGQATVLADNPDKLKSYDTDSPSTLASQFRQYLKHIETEFIVFSPYFVPGKRGTEFLCDLSKKGVNVRILTNSLSSTDVDIVHAGYAKHRTTLLRAGVEIYEMNKTLHKKEHKGKKDHIGASKSSLHAKSYVLDRKNVFVGSLNLDPRSIVQNTEIGIMLHSEKIADEILTGFDRMVNFRAFRLELITDEDGIEYIRWHGLEDGVERTWNHDPYSSVWRRFGVFLMSLLPIESQI